MPGSRFQIPVRMLMKKSLACFLPFVWCSFRLNTEQNITLHMFFIPVQIEFEFNGVQLKLFLEWNPEITQPRPQFSTLNYENNFHSFDECIQVFLLHMLSFSNPISFPFLFPIHQLFGSLCNVMLCHSI